MTERDSMEMVILLLIMFPTALIIINLLNFFDGDDD